MRKTVFVALALVLLPVSVSAECLPSARAVYKAHRGVDTYPKYTLREIKGYRCWYNARAERPEHHASHRRHPEKGVVVALPKPRPERLDTGDDHTRSTPEEGVRLGRYLSDMVLFDLMVPKPAIQPAFTPPLMGR